MAHLAIGQAAMMATARFSAAGCIAGEEFVIGAGEFGKLRNNVNVADTSVRRLLLAEDVGRVAEEHLGRLQDSFRQGRMRMHDGR